jgi:hypothetical protein
VRILFRLVEFSAGNDGSNPMLTNEAYFFALEGVPMLLAVFAFNLIHPGRILVGPGSEMPGVFSRIRTMFKTREERGSKGDGQDSD